MEAQITLDFVESEPSQPVEIPAFGLKRRTNEEQSIGLDCVRENLLSEREHFREMTRLAVMPDMATYYSDECALREAQLDRLFPSWRG